MKIDETIAELICDLEYEIAGNTYNPRSYNGWTGEEGCGYTYPVKYCKNKKDLEGHKISDAKKISYIDPDCIDTMKLVFGSNHLFIGNGLIDALEYLENRYDIDFNKMEEDLIKKREQKMIGIRKKLEEGEEVIIGPGKIVGGTDLPAGKYYFSKAEKARMYACIDVYDSDGKIIDFYYINETKEVDISDGYILKAESEYCMRKA